MRAGEHSSAEHTCVAAVAAIARPAKATTRPVAHLLAREGAHDDRGHVDAIPAHKSLQGGKRRPSDGGAGGCSGARG
jgi:hypothetical protein